MEVRNRRRLQPAQERIGIAKSGSAVENRDNTMRAHRKRSSMNAAVGLPRANVMYSSRSPQESRCRDRVRNDEETRDSTAKRCLMERYEQTVACNEVDSAIIDADLPSRSTEDFEGELRNTRASWNASNGD